MTPQAALQEIEQDKVRPCYFLFGEETFYHTEIIHSLTGKLITADNREFNHESLDVKTTGVQDWIAAAKTFSFLGGTKLVLVRDLHEITLTPKEADALIAYVKDPAPESCLVLTALKADRKKKIFKTLCKESFAVECAAPRESALLPWLKKRAEAQGYRLSGEAANILIARTGPKPGILASELEKVLTFAGKNRTVTEEEASRVVGESRQENAFALTDALKDKNGERALRLLHNQLDHGEDPIKVMGSIAWQFRVLWEVKALKGRKLPAARIAQEMGAKPFLVEKAIRYTENFTRQELKRSFQYLAEADRKLKTSGGDPQAILESLVLRLCFKNANGEG